LIVERKGSRYETCPRLFPTPIEPLVAAYDERRQRDQAKLEQIVIHAQTALCRTRLLLGPSAKRLHVARVITAAACRFVLKPWRWERRTFSF
jgi:hypothetical protein